MIHIPLRQPVGAAHVHCPPPSQQILGRPGSSCIRPHLLALRGAQSQELTRGQEAKERRQVLEEGLGQSSPGPGDGLGRQVLERAQLTVAWVTARGPGEAGAGASLLGLQATAALAGGAPGEGET